MLTGLYGEGDSTYEKIIERIKAEGIAPPDGVNWKELYRIQTAMRYMDANPSMTKESVFLMADTDIRCALSANTPKPEDV